MPTETIYAASSGTIIHNNSVNSLGSLSGTQSVGYLPYSAGTKYTPETPAGTRMAYFDWHNALDDGTRTGHIVSTASFSFYVTTANTTVSWITAHASNSQNIGNNPSMSSAIGGNIDVTTVGTKTVTVTSQVQDWLATNSAKSFILQPRSNLGATSATAEIWPHDYSTASQRPTIQYTYETNSLPAASQSSPTEGAIVNTGNPSLNGAITDTNSNQQIRLEFEVADTSFFNNVIRSGASSYTTSPKTNHQMGWTVSPSLPDGTYYWRVRAYDGIGYSYWTGARTLVVQLNNTPSISPSSPANSATVNVGTPTFTVAVTDPDQDQNLTVTFEVDTTTSFNSGNKVTGSSSTGTPASNKSVTWTPSLPFADGTWYWRARVWDSADATSGWTTTRTLIVDAITNWNTNIGTAVIDDMYIGDQEVDAMYVGTQNIFTRIP